MDAAQLCFISSLPSEIKLEARFPGGFKTPPTLWTPPCVAEFSDQTHFKKLSDIFSKNTLYQSQTLSRAGVFSLVHRARRSRKSLETKAELKKKVLFTRRRSPFFLGRNGCLGAQGLVALALRWMRARGKMKLEEQAGRFFTRAGRACAWRP